MRNSFILFFSVLLLCACEDKIILDFDRFDKRLVVEALVTDEERPYYIRLFYTSPYTYTLDSLDDAAGAEVRVEDDLGNIYLFTEEREGLYRSNPFEFVGKAGRRYTLHIKTGEGKVYQSKPELLKPVSPIEDIYLEFSKNRDEYRLYIDTFDPLGLGDLYQWRIIYDNRLFDNIDISKDDYFDGMPLKRFNKETSEYHGEKVRITIQQLSLTRSAYDFLYLLREQTINVGTNFDTPPAPVIGNVYNAENETDYALGFFGVSSVSAKSVQLE